MALNIEKLLKQDGWTGQELGILSITVTLDAFKQIVNGVKEPKLLVSNAEFNKMLRTIKDPIDGETYNGYLKIQEWVSKVYNMALSQQQQAELRYNVFLNRLSNAQTAENLYRYISKLPVIMTTDQYNDFVAQQREELLHPEDGTTGFNLFQMMAEAIDYYSEQLRKSPRKKNPLKPLRKKLEAELVTNPRITSRYNEVMGDGYYILSDGTRSDEVSLEEWQKAIAPEVVEALEAGDEQKIDKFTTDRILELAHKLYNGLNSGMNEGTYKLYKEELEEGLFQKPEWHYYEDPPEDINKWEVLEYARSFFPSLEEDIPDGETYEEAIVEDARTFIKEFPTVATAILKDMEQHIKGVSSIPVEKWADTLLTWEELFSMNLYGFRDIYFSHDIIFDGNWRAQMHGVALLLPDTTLHCKDDFDSKGYYQPPDIKEAIVDFSLEAFFTENEEYAQNVNGIESSRTMLLDSLYWINGYNNALDLIAKYFKLDVIKMLKLNLSSFEDKLEALNDFVALLYNQIANTDYEDEELKLKKLGVLKDIFYPFDLKETETPPAKLSVAKSWIKDFKAFYEGKYELTELLCIR